MRILKAIGGAVMAVACGGALVSCGGNFPLTPEALQARGLKPGEGYIVATFHEKTVMPSGKVENISGAEAHVWIKGPNDDASASLGPLQAPLGKNPYATGGRHSEVLAIPMPAGKYSVSSWSMIGQAMTATVSVRNRLPMDAPFEVKPGEATYVGRMNAITFTGRNLLGLPVFSRGVVVVTDEFAQDQARIAKTYPTIKAGSIRRSNVAAEYQQEMKRIADTPEEPAWKKILF